MGTKPHIFISYSSKDVQIGEQLHKHLESSDYEVWRDRERLGIGANWSMEISKALVASKVVILLWSEHSANSKWVTNEWTTARGLGKNIIPCFLPNAPILPSALYC